MNTEYFVKLDRFEGPLDLLLYLIKAHELDIFAINIFKLTNEYLAFLRLMNFADLSDAGEFLSMAAHLIEIKSRRLLPQTEQQSKNDDEEEEDPLAELQKRLLEYERIKAAGEYLAIRPTMGVGVQTNHESTRLESVFSHVEAPLQGDPVTLIVMYEQLMSELAFRNTAHIQAKTHLVTLDEIIEKLKGYMETVRFCMFQSFYHTFESRYHFVVQFLAVLELVKTGFLKVFQSRMHGPLWVYVSECDTGLIPGLQDALLLETAVTAYD